MPSLAPGSSPAVDAQPEARRHGSADGRQQWRSLGELERGLEPSAEFPEGAAEPPDGVSRRSFLQILGASAALATLDACRPPRQKIYPYVRPPEKAMLPGTALHYATALSLGGYATGLLVTCVDGRPIKVEGNPDHPASLGGVASHDLAAILDLYDPRRARGFSKGANSLAYRSLLRELAAVATAHQKDGGAGLRFLTDAMGSPLRQDLRRRIQERFPRSRFHAFESVSRQQVRDGAQLAFGRTLEPRHRLDDARVVVSLDSDFLYFGPEALRLARQFAAHREPGGDMNRLYVVESELSVTGACADHRFPLRPSEVVAFGRAIAARLAAQHGMGALAPLGADAGRFAKQAAAVADDLARHRGRSVVMVGPRQPPAVHALAHAMNAALGNAGRTVVYGPPPFQDDTGPASLKQLVADLAAGAVDTLVITASNPVYTAPPDIGLAAQIGKARNSIYLTRHDDETSEQCNWSVAASHPFETWGDARAFDGTVTIAQPLIEPLFESISDIELLGGFLDVADQGAYRIVQEFWRERAGADFHQQWPHWLQRGVVPNTATPGEAPQVRVDAVAAALGGPGGGSAGAQPAAGRLEVNFVPDTKVYDGRFAENAWLQELPQPVVKMTWDNAAFVSPNTARRLAIENGSRVELQVAGRKVEAAIWIMPGHAEDVVTLPLGYGRKRAGVVGTGVGFDAGALRTSDALWFASGLGLRRIGGGHPFAMTQEHFSMEGRDIALTFLAPEWKPESIEHLKGPVPTIQQPVDYQQQQYKWGMAIDLSRCVGCAACVIACQAENNIPVVGKEQVARSREMHWLRVDRYYSGDPENPEVIAQPMMCQHCETAPCEYVCPVNATVHSDEGLNEMIYNRCVGTRYCSNNCPYKVRHFNYLDFRGSLAPTEKMAMNPDVTVRTRGVMEKCTYCVQRVERARIESRVQGRTIKEGEFTTACAQACPASAIVFGNLNDPNAHVTKLHRDERRYDVLHENGTRPRTAYLVRIRNPNPELS